MKSKSTAMWLAFLLGGFGAHKFYLGESQGWLYLVFCWTYMPFLAGFVDGIGLARMSEEDFNKKYNPQATVVFASAPAPAQSQQDAINQAVAMAVAATTAANAAQAAVRQHYAPTLTSAAGLPPAPTGPQAFTCRSCGANNNVAAGAAAVCNFCGTPA